MSAGRLDPARVTALVPCHLEPPSEELVAGILEHVGRVLIVDDGLPPAARASLAARAARTEVDATATNGNRGKGHALAKGLNVLLARRPAPEAVLTIDADGQHPPACVPALLAAGSDAELVVGNRFPHFGRMPLERRAANWLASRTLQLVTHVPVQDSQCGMRLLRGRALHEIPFEGGGYEAEARHLKRCLVAGVRVTWVEIPTIYEGAPSSFRVTRDTIRVAIALLR